jgi:hypothetical protein
MESICSYEWDDVDAGVLCRYLGMGMSGRATHLPRDWSFVRANAYGVYCHAFTLQLNGDFPEHEQIRDSSLDFL